MSEGKKGTMKILKESNFDHKNSNNLVHIFGTVCYIKYSLNLLCSFRIRRWG